MNRGNCLRIICFCRWGTLNVTVSGANGSIQYFRVYANELLGTDDIAKPAAAAGQEANSLVLVTCENESVEGGCLNRRVVFAKPN